MRTSFFWPECVTALVVSFKLSLLSSPFSFERRDDTKRNSMDARMGVALFFRFITTNDSELCIRKPVFRCTKFREANWHSKRETSLCDFEFDSVFGCLHELRHTETFATLGANDEVLSHSQWTAEFHWCSFIRRFIFRWESKMPKWWFCYHSEK